ncbi:MAG: 2-thiouracil desulfurase family protein [Desulfocucumaceae bacterium]
MGEKALILVSGCLAGVLCKYNGTYNDIPEIIQMVEGGMAIPVCPELLGGGAVPREPNEIVEGDGHAVLDGKARVMTPSGLDCTGQFILGAEEVLKIAVKNNIKAAILKERSPSCGSGIVYDGTFTGRKVAGGGVTAALLQRSGIKVYSEYNFREALKELTSG